MRPIYAVTLLLAIACSNEESQPEPQQAQTIAAAPAAEVSAESANWLPPATKSRAAAGEMAKGEGATLVVYKSPTCDCCAKWVEHLKGAGHSVDVKEEANMAAIKGKLGVPSVVQSCHTGTAGGYFIEGHVPAEDVVRLLKEKPQIAGLAVPGMPRGSPGMEGGPPERYQTLAVKKDGSTYLFASH